MTTSNIKRCDWATNELAIGYHDFEWGVPVHEDRRFFEFLILEGAQAGLSWDTILRKRATYQKAFSGFDPEKVAKFGEAKIELLLNNAGLVRNRLKLSSAISNARAFLDVQNEFGTFDAFVWRFVNGHPKANRWKHISEVPASTPESDALSKELKRRGFRFVGTTICYAFMQATGLVNDHLVGCFRRDAVAAGC